MFDFYHMINEIRSKDAAKKFAKVYGYHEEEINSVADRYCELLLGFKDHFSLHAESNEPIYFFTSPGRTEIGGNHTDHQRGLVLAASIDLDTIAAVRLNNTNFIRIKSKGYPLDLIDLNNLEIQEEERNTSAALIRGIAARFYQLGYPISGFDAYTISIIPKGSGLSSSAAFEVLLGNIMNTLFADSKLDPITISIIGQFAENTYYGKPCGLMDQIASAIGGIITIDFENSVAPDVVRIPFDLNSAGFALCLISSGEGHDDLTHEYASIPNEMSSVAKFFGYEQLRDLDEEQLISNIPILRNVVSDRAIMRALHFFAENRRVCLEASALQACDFILFNELVIESGRSSSFYLQNTYATGSIEKQSIALTLALCERFLHTRGGAWRIHGGGFAGTVQALVPLSDVKIFVSQIEHIIGKDSCHMAKIRPVGGCFLFKLTEHKIIQGDTL